MARFAVHAKWLCLAFTLASTALALGELELVSGDAEGKDSDSQAFDCNEHWGEGLGSWESVWSSDKQEWCCTHKNLGCGAKPAFDCENGLANWKIGWSGAKQAWCCGHKGVGCPESNAPVPVQTGSKSLRMKSQVVDSLVTSASGQGACGVSAVMNDDGIFRPPQQLDTGVCNHHMTTNCSVSYHAMRCPSGCDYLVPNHHFVCVFECVPAEKCSASNSNRAFPDPETGLCTSCALEGCKVCESQSKCASCHPGFTLNADGSGCVFDLDMAMHTNDIVCTVKYLIAFIVLVAVIWRIVRGLHVNRVENMTAIDRARRHRHLCKVQDWQLGNSKLVRQRYPLTVNVHRVHILGVGLPLFYNSICSLALIALLFWGATFLVFKQSGVSVALASTDRSAAALVEHAMRPALQSPAVVLSPLSVCSESSAKDIMQELRDFASMNFYTIGALYVLTFALSLLHGKLQLSGARRYDAENKTMADYALRVAGLREELTDEHALKEKFQEALRKDAGAEAAEVIGVSVCYNYSEVRSEVDAMKDRLVERMDLDLEKKKGALDGRSSSDVPIEAKHTTMGDDWTIQEMVVEDRKRAKAWFDGNSRERLNSTGELFLVLKRHAGRDAVWRARRDVSEHLKDLAAPGKTIEFFEVFSEPPAVNWWHLSTSAGERNTKCVWAGCKILAIIAAVQMLIVVPFTYHIVWPYSVTGSSAGGAKMQIAGMILGNVNMFVSLQIFFTSYDLGFHRKSSMDLMILCANTALVMVNTFFNIGTTALMVFSRQDDGFGLWTFLEIESLVAIGVEGSLASNIYHTLMPGTFFVGYLMCIIMAGVVPFVWNSILMKLIYIWRCLPDCLLNTLKVFLPWAGDLSLEHYPYRRAEKGFEPMEIGISWDYTASIVNPTVCFTMLFFVSPYVWQTFLMMFVSTCFYYCFCRYQHLRFCKACYYTTNRLDTTANFLWGIPLSVIATACCVWGMRSEHLAVGVSVPAKFAMVAGAFCCSLVLWVLTYWLVLDPYTQKDADENEDADYEEVKADTLYSWFNCNPLYVLKCEYYTRHHSRTPCSITQGHGALKVRIVSACGLRNADRVPFAGASDPYCVCEIVGKPQLKHITSEQANKCDPVWNSIVEFFNYTPGDALSFSVLDKDMLTHDDCLGKVVVSGDEVLHGFDKELELDNGGRSTKAFLRVQVEPIKDPFPQTTVSIKAARGLRDADVGPGGGASDPYCVCQVPGKPALELRTLPASRTSEPRWNFATGVDLDAGDSLVFKVMDKDVLKKDDSLGTVTISAAQIREGVAGEFPLDKSGKAFIALEVRPPAEGLRHESSTSRGHPFACGEDQSQVRFFEVGKEYLFVKPEKQALVLRDLADSLEIETHLEWLLAGLGRLADPWMRFAMTKVRQLPGLPAHSESREVLVGRPRAEP